MDWAPTEEQERFRDEVRSFIEEQLPDHYRRRAERGGEVGHASGWQHDRFHGSPEAQAAAIAWQDAVAARGWTAPHWAKEYGGAGMTPMEQFILRQELAAAAAPEVGGQGVTMLGPTLIAHGTEQQKRRFLPKTLSGEITWAQGYSEPSAGSDLASLQTRAVRDGDEYVVNGQKIWTSNAHRADWIFALVRTEPDAPKHRGISFLLMDIKTPGIEVRPLISLGWEHFSNETFYQEVRVPADQVVGEVNRGWYVGMTLLDYERSNITGAVQQRRVIEELRDYLRTLEGRAQSRAGELPTVRAEIADRYIESEVLFNFSFRIISLQNAGMIPNYEASTSKLFASESAQALQRTGIKAFGLHANIWDPEDSRTPQRARFTQQYVHLIPSTIAGGSSEIQRNIIATRGLGLPRS